MDIGLHCRHEAQFYSSDSVFVESLAGFIASALKSQNSAIVVATKSHRESLIGKLTAEGFDLDAAIGEGMYISLDAAQTLSTIMVNGELDRLRFFESLGGFIEKAAKAAKTEHPRVAICGEGVGLLCADGNLNAAIRIEQVVNDLAASHEVEIMCAYPLDCFQDEGSDAYRRICAEHTAVYSG